ncbi:hypothetical protein BH11PSE5_BH11PSE5_22110 [soil metagenome]
MSKDDVAYVAHDAGVGAIDTVDLGTAETARCFVDAWRYMVAHYPGHVVAQVGPVAVTLSQTNCPFFNLITIDAPTENAAALHQALTTARGYAEGCPHATMLLLSPDWLPKGASDVLTAQGVAFSMSLTGMATDALAAPRRADPKLDFRLTSDEATALDLGRVNADAYGMPHELFAITGRIPHWTGTQVGAVGYIDGQPVTAAQAYVLGERIYIAMVATHPRHHGKGYGEEAMRRAIAAVQEVAGHKRLWLHASDMGRPLYRAMGFADGARLDLYGFA